MLGPADHKKIEEAGRVAEEVLIHNSHGPYHGLPRTAGWGYPEPYTRDLMFSILGIAALDNKKLLNSIKTVLETLALHQTKNGHIPSLVHDNKERGSSDTTPLFLFGAGIFRKITDDNNFLEQAVIKAFNWMKYQSPSDRYLVAQQPTSDWRDEQWVTGYGLYVNTLVYIYLRLFNFNEIAENFRREFCGTANNNIEGKRHALEGFTLKDKPYFAFWSYKIYSNNRYDLLGNSLAILSGLASQSKALKIISWTENECSVMKNNHELAVDLPPNFFPFIREGDEDWNKRYYVFNKPGEYHNGGIWPFICGFYIAALVAAKKFRLAEKKLMILTDLVTLGVNRNLEFGFNEWFKAQDGKPHGQDWQTWSAALYLYAAKCVVEQRTPLFDDIRNA